MASWQTHAVCAYLRATRKKRYRTTEAGLQSMAHAIAAAPLPDGLRDRTSVAPLAGGEVATVRPDAGSPADAGALVYLHGDLVDHTWDDTELQEAVAEALTRLPAIPG